MHAHGLALRPPSDHDRTLSVPQVHLCCAAASKTALNGILLSYVMNLEEGSPVKINNVCPGYCATDLNGGAGARTPEQGAQISIKMALLGPEGPCGELWKDSLQNGERVKCPW